MSEGSEQTPSAKEKVLTVGSAITLNIVGHNFRDNANFAIGKHEYRNATNLSAEAARSGQRQGQGGVVGVCRGIEGAAPEGPPDDVRSCRRRVEAVVGNR